MAHKRINPLLLIGLIGTFIIGAHLVTNITRAFWGNQDTWWTARTMRLPFEESTDHLELYIFEKPFQKHLAEGTLFVKSAEGSHHPIEKHDVSVRLNSWYEVKASILANTLVTSFMCGIALTSLVLGLMQVLSKKEQDASAHPSSSP